MSTNSRSGQVGLAALGLLLLATSSAVGQERYGSIKGHVADHSNNALPGASVRVDPGNATAVTDREGGFLIGSLAPGNFKVSISYVGFVTDTQDLVVTAGAQAKIESKLRPAVNVSEEVTVTASRSRGEVEALNQKKNADNIVDILPAEVITSLPNANVADAIGRLPSVSLERDEGEGKYVQVRGLESRYTNATVNGAHIPNVESFNRSLKLDAIPSNLVGQIELHKTVSPDQDGDAIGGSVNLVTKIAGDQPSFSIGTQGGYVDLQGGRYTYQVDATYTNRFGPDKNLGLVIGGTYDWNGRAINDVEPAPGTGNLPDGTPFANFMGADLRDYRYKRSRLGFAGGLDYRPSQNSSFYLRGLYADFHNYGDVFTNTASAGTFLTPTLTDDSGGFSGYSQIRTHNEETYSISAGGKHNLGTAFLDYNLSYSHARQTGGFVTTPFNGPSAAFMISPSTLYFPKFTALGGVNQLDATQYSVAAYQTIDNTTPDRDAAIAVNVALPYRNGGGEFKIGAKYRDEAKSNLQNNKSFSATGSPALLLSQAPGDLHDPNYYFGSYPHGPNLDFNAAQNFFNQNPNAFVELVSQEHSRNDGNNYDAKEKIAAVYAMNTIKFGQVHVVAGVRMEHTDASYSGFQVHFDSSGNWVGSTPTGADNKYTSVLPSVQVRYEIDPNTNLRAVYGWAISRPNYADLVPSLVISDRRNQVNAGNPNLKPTKGQSYDLLFEHYLATVGVISAGAFYKDLKDPIYPGSGTTLVSGPFAGFQQVQPINGPSAKVWGFETAWNQHLSFLPGLLNGLGIAANYTYTDSKATFDPSTGRTGTARLQRTTPNEFNVGLTYDKGGFSLRAAATYNSATIFSYNYSDGAQGGLTGPNGDTYLYPHTQIDAQASYTFKNGFQVLVSGLNLNNEVFGFYVGSPQWNIQREFYGPTIGVGFRLNR
ncbi:MAG TPA: TonB-dependent receptor [Vicinamibacteria bacterium]|nr:TonB-dependent receptor [Vicinamibacteria bacterium]